MLEILSTATVTVLGISLIVFSFRIIRYWFSGTPILEIKNAKAKHDYLLKKHTRLIGQKHKHRKIKEIHINPPWSKHGNWRVVGWLDSEYDDGTHYADRPYVEMLSRTILKIADSELNEIPCED